MSYFHNSYVYHTHCINISIYQHSAIVLAVVSKFSGRKPHSLFQSSTSKSMLGSCFLRVGRDNSSKNKDTRNDLWQRFCWTTQPNNISTHSRFVIVQFWKPPVCIRWRVTNPLTRACSFVPFVLSFILLHLIYLIPLNRVCFLGSSLYCIIFLFYQLKCHDFSFSKSNSKLRSCFTLFRISTNG